METVFYFRGLSFTIDAFSRVGYCTAMAAILLSPDP